MSTQTISKRIENLGVLLLTFFMSALAFAQETTAPAVDITTTSTTTTTEEWYTNPIYWVIGALIFIVIIAIVARGNSNKD
ncbi:hypothetical protein [Chryseobacterium sp. MP_3.2]|uniref:hypothetical protein n=1 Tax=Chryseobacterium sp. MP_3.2 TaxID=3071712 RepID=UPI002E0C2821|nr:SNF family Na+-dependent transporter [Chryseobacterium sp. MP_3.2]